MVSFPYYSHTTPTRIPKDMGIVLEAYHKGVPLLGVPGITLEIMNAECNYFKMPIQERNYQIVECHEWYHVSSRPWGLSNPMILILQSWGLIRFQGS